MSDTVFAHTIFALSTAPGRAGVAVLRVSGPQAWDSLKALSAPGAPMPGARQATLRILHDPVSRETIDRAMTIGFRAPASFTGEDTIEYHCHGSTAVIQALTDALAKLPGLRPAEPGEFTRRAFENGKMDLTAAEGLADLIDAQTQAQKAQALSQMEGALARLYDKWRTALTRSLAHVEAVIDFPDEDVPDEETLKILPDVRHIKEEIAAHLSDGHRGERLREGIRIAVIGAPNAGKSTLVNALARRDIAIVSDTAGTTRDVIEAHLDFGGYPVILSDTAGLRPGQLSNEEQDAIESEGIRRALICARDADIRLLVFDGTTETPDLETSALIDDKSLIIVNKSDKHAAACDIKADARISARTGAGLEDLIRILTTRMAALAGRQETPALTRARHRTALEDCHMHLENALKTPPPELMAESLRLAVRALGRLTGRVDVEDLLDVIFQDFCIGK